MSTAETPTPLTDAELEEIRLVVEARITLRHEAAVRLLSTIDHYKALSTGRVEDGDAAFRARTQASRERAIKQLAYQDCILKLESILLRSTANFDEFNRGHQGAVMLALELVRALVSP